MANKRGRTYEASDMLGMMRRTAKALVRRAETGDTEALVALAEARQAIDAAMLDAAAGLRAAGHTWDTIGGELGITRQTAQQRFGVREVRAS